MTRTRTLSYAKALVESIQKKRIADDEVVHHIDGDRLHDVLSNLSVVKRSAHSYSHTMKYAPYRVKCYFVAIL